MEWLFLATKPSSLSMAPFSGKLAALGAGAFPFLAGALLLHVVLLGAGRAVAKVTGFERVFDVAMAITPALLLTILALLMLDNFTYTVFGWGVASTTSLDRALYLLEILIVFAVLLQRQLRRNEAAGWLSARMWASVALFGLSATSVGLLLVTGEDYEEEVSSNIAPSVLRNLPNIIFFASDGVNARRTSAYGYERKTTPWLDDNLDRALVFDNAFTNASKTAASLTSMVTGRYPATTKVFHPPNRLWGTESYETLPRILRELGYRSLQESTRYWADGPDLNWRQAFDYANRRAVRNGLFVSRTPMAMKLQLPVSLLEEVLERVAERLEHLFFISTFVNQHKVVTSAAHAHAYGAGDVNRMKRVYNFIENSEPDVPFFVHIHLMSTHCCDFSPQNAHFSKGEFDSEEARLEARYDDTILESDGHLAELMSLLEKKGLLSNTLVVYSSDHTKKWGFEEQVPLAFFFPGGTPSGRVSAPAQLLDVMPTVLEYVGLPAPTWLEGDSLLQEGLDKRRPLFAMSQLAEEKNLTSGNDKTRRQTRGAGPLAYGLSRFGMVSCQRWYTLSLEDGSVHSGEVAGYPDPCDVDELLPDEVAKEMISRHLIDRGFSF